MNIRREVSLGLLAALVSLIIIGGSFIVSLAEDKISISQLPQVITSSPIPTMVIFTPRPGEPSLTPSLFPSPTEQEASSSTSACPNHPGWMEIMINPGDTLESLAAMYNVSVDELKNGNCLPIDKLIPGTFLYVPALLASSTPTQRPLPTACRPPWGWIVYTIKSGDTLYSIAKAFGISTEKLMAENCLFSTKIFPGDIIWVPNVSTITPIPSLTPTSTPSFTPSITPPQLTTTATNTNASTPTPTVTLTTTPSPASNTPTHTPTSTPTNTATAEPTDAPTITPSTPYP